MVVYNYSGKEINAKIVYYGPALSGKTTNLEWIYSKIPTEYSGKMVSLRTQADRTIFFDFLPLELGMIDGFKTRFMLYTVPGQVYYNATRKMVLKGVDGIVFVADSEQGRMADNLESYQNLRENLAELGLDLATIPHVVQWNKRDLSNLDSVEELEAQINAAAAPSFEASAPTGQGVYETLHRICRMVYQKLTMGDHAMPAEEASGESLFGTTIATSLQEIDHPEAVPERLALDPEDPEDAMPADDRPVLDTILGRSPEAEPATPAAPIPDPQPSAASASEDDLVTGLVDEVLGRLDESAEEGFVDPMPTTPTPAPEPVAAPRPVTPDGRESTSDGFAPVASTDTAGPMSGIDLGDLSVESEPDADAPLIEHDSDPFAREDEPEDPPSDGHDLQLITDPLKRTDVSSSVVPTVGASRPFGGRATDAKVLEVPITLDADALEEGKTIRVVLNLTVSR